MTSHNIHGVTRIELRDIVALSDGSFYRTICITDRDGNCHDISLFANGTDADVLRFDAEKEAAERRHQLLVLLAKATALMEQSGHGDMIAKGRKIDRIASVIEDDIYVAEQKDQAELADREGWKEDTR